MSLTGPGPPFGGQSVLRVIVLSGAGQKSPWSLFGARNSLLPSLIDPGCAGRGSGSVHSNPESEGEDHANVDQSDHCGRRLDRAGVPVNIRDRNRIVNVTFTVVAVLVVGLVVYVVLYGLVVAVMGFAGAFG